MTLRTQTLGLAALVALLGAPAAVAGDAAIVSCTPTTIQVDGGPFAPVTNPIARALEAAAPGATITLDPGDYPGFRIGFDRGDEAVRTSGGTEFAPIVVRGGAGVRVRAGSGGDTMAVTQERPNGWITFEGLEFEPSYRSAILFYKVGPGQVHRGYRFIDCDIIGGWDHLEQEGATSKWGLWGQALADFEWVGRTRPSVVRDIRHEHGFYLQNLAGDVRIENVTATRLGRTFLQVTARAAEGPPGVGTLTVKDCRISDTCIAAGDDYKGGSAFTIAGRMPEAQLRFQGNTYRAGFDPKLRGLTREGVPYGTGAFVAWDGGEQALNGTLVLVDNDFRMASGCGDRPLVSISACREVRLEGTNRFHAGAFPVALALDAPERGGLAPRHPNGRVRLDARTAVRGRLELSGHEATAAERAALGLVSPPAPPR